METQTNPSTNINEIIPGSIATDKDGNETGSENGADRRGDREKFADFLAISVANVNEQFDSLEAGYTGMESAEITGEIKKASELKESATSAIENTVKSN